MLHRAIPATLRRAVEAASPTGRGPVLTGRWPHRGTDYEGHGKHDSWHALRAVRQGEASGRRFARHAIRRGAGRSLIVVVLGCAALLPSPLTAGPLRIMALGDSNTHGNGAYPTLLQQGLDAQWGVGATEVINHGINGQTADQLANNLLDMGWLSEDPDLALVMIGGNDLAPLLGSTTLPEFFQFVRETVNDVQRIVDLLKAHVNADGSTPRVLVSAYPPNLLPDVSLGALSINPNLGVWIFNHRLQNQLMNADYFFTNNWDDILDPVTHRARADLMRDTMHMNQAGRQVLADNWQRALVAFIPEPSGLSLAVGGAAWVAWGCRSRFAPGARYGMMLGGYFDSW